MIRAATAPHTFGTRTFGRETFIFALVLSACSIPLAAKASPDTSALASLRATAATVASRSDVDRAALRGPARAIAVTWAKIEPAYAADDDTVVETRMLNRAIASLERDWASDVYAAPADAHRVAAAASNLLRAAR